MKRYLLCFLIFSLIFGNSITYVKAEDNLQLYAKAAVLMDAESGRILFSKNGQKNMPMASTTKIMTCILALEYSNYDKEIIFSKEAASQPKVHLGACEGEKFLLRDLLYSLMLESHNDTAVAVAEGIGGSVHDFTELMNAKAHSIGCEHTHFVTPNGLDSSDSGGEHSTSASDLAKIMKYCIYDSNQKDSFLEITRTSDYTFSNMKRTRQYTCHNHNAFLQMMPGALSGKTGFTANAGYCYVGALKDDHRTFIVALLACGWPNHKGYKWSDTQKLMQYGMKRYRYNKITIPQLPIINVTNGLPEKQQIDFTPHIHLKYDVDLSSRSVLMRDDEIIDTEIHMKESIMAPIKKNQKIGQIYYKIGNDILFSSNIISKNQVQEWNFKWAIQYICMNFMKMIR